MGTIYLIRHGQASFGADDYDVLSPIGFRQAEVVGNHLAQLGIQLDRSLSGALRRQQNTANTALKQLKAAGLPAPLLEVDSAFDEFDAEAVIRALLPDLLVDEPQALEVMRNAAQQPAEFQRIFSKLIERWLSGDYDKLELQSWPMFVQQVETGLRRLLASAGDKQQIAIFTSGGTITALLHLITGIAPTKAFELNWQIINTSLSCLKFKDQHVRLASFNSQVHLQLLKVPELITYR